MSLANNRAPFRLALIQMLVEGGRWKDNLERAETRICEAAAHGAQVVVLPEALTAGWTHPSAPDLAEGIPGGRAYERLANCARAKQVYVCAGLDERTGGKVYNSAVLIGPAGELLLHHRKIYELEIGHPTYALGERLAVKETDLGTFGLMICADAFAPGQVISRTLGFMGAEVILSPCAWAVPAEHDNRKEPYGQLWRDNYIPVARSFRMWIAGVSNVGRLEAGPWSGRHCIGCSLLIDPSGAVATEGAYGVAADQILYADVRAEAPIARGDGWERIWTA